LLRYIILFFIVWFVLALLFWIGHVSNEKADMEYPSRQKYDDEEQAKAIAEWRKEQDEKKNNK